MTDALKATLQWHDRFDKSFGVTASDCSELLDWPGKTVPFGEKFLLEKVADIMGDEVEQTVDFDFLNRIRGQVKFDTYKSELIDTNPDLSALKETKIVFLMRSAGEARVMPKLDGGVIVADALWLSYANFCAQSIFATFPQLHEQNATERRFMVSLHFGMRALLYQEILRKNVLRKDKYQIIWETWPTEWDNFDAAIFTWTGLGRFIVAHELAHIIHHAPENCTPEKAWQRGIVPKPWILALHAEGDSAPLDDFLYEVEADLSGLRMCENYLVGVNAKPYLRTTLLCGAYYMFMCLEELARKVGAKTVYPQRTRCIGAYLRHHPLVGNEIVVDTEQQFVGRAKFYFNMSDTFAAMRPAK
jgi:hypothetical protein